MSDEQSESGQAIESTSEVPEKFRNEEGGLDSSKLLTSYQHLESKQGSMYSMPTEDSSPEKWGEFSEKVINTGKFISRPDPENPEAMNSFYNQLGRPETVEGYNVSIPDASKEFVSEEKLKEYTNIAHSAGLSNDQTQALVNFELERINNQNNKAIEVRQDAEKQLRESWGIDYDNRLAGAKAVINSYHEKYPDAINELLNGPAGNNPALIAILSELGNSTQESTHAGQVRGTPYGISREEALEKLEEIRNNLSHPANNPSDPGFKEAYAKKVKYVQIAGNEG